MDRQVKQLGRIQRQAGHKLGGGPAWRNYGVSIVAIKTPRAAMLVGTGESWWAEYAHGERNDSGFMAEAYRRFPSESIIAEHARST